LLDPSEDGAAGWSNVAASPALTEIKRRRQLAQLDSDFPGLPGSAEELAGLARSMAAMYAEYRDERGQRSMDHSTSVMVVDPAGRVVAALPAPHDPAVMRQRFLALQRHFER